MRQQDYRAIEIIKDENCDCLLSKHSGKRILMSEYHNLVKHSVSHGCRCKLRHHADRRSGRDRRDFSLEALVHNQFRRQQPFGRRQTDEMIRMEKESAITDFKLTA